ncbi:MAG: hypothetical protein IIU11_01020 [Bacteroidales bacterium]|nr:hypothetical protein [Bacteroidales bacterium]
MINMKRTLAAFMIVCAAFMSACSGNSGGSAAEKNVNQKEKSTLPENALTPLQIFNKGEELIDKEVIIAGKVTHVCKGTGKKCFVSADDDSTMSMQIFVGGEIDTFPREIMYKNIAISGIVKVNKISKSRILESEEAQKSKIPSDTSTEENCKIMERCHSVMKQLANMKSYMEKHGTDYYPVYYVESRKYVK